MFQGGTLFWRKEGVRGEGGDRSIITVIIIIILKIISNHNYHGDQNDDHHDNDDEKVRGGRAWGQSLTSKPTKCWALRHPQYALS